MSITLRVRQRLLTVAVGAALTVLTGCTYATHGTGAIGGFLAPATPSANPSVGTGTGNDNAPAPTQAQLNSVILRDGDLPDNWQTGDDSGDSGGDDSSVTSTVPACAGLHATENDEVNDAESDYTDGQTQLSSSVVSFSSRADITTDDAYVLSPQYVQCFDATAGKEVQSGLPAGTTVSSVAMTIVRGQTPANLVATAHSVMTITDDHGPLRLYQDDVFISGPQLEAQLTFTGANGPVSPAFEAPVIALVAKRAAAV